MEKTKTNSCLFSLHGPNCFRIFILNLFRHNDKSCPNYEEDPSKRLTPDKLSYEDSYDSFEKRMTRLKSEFPAVKSYEIVRECEFKRMLESKDPPKVMEDFKKNILPSLIFFERLSPRDSCFGGTTELLQAKWQQHENLNESLQFVDINAAHSYCSTLPFPYGKCSIFLQPDIDNLVIFDNAKGLCFKNSMKPIYGFVKASIIPSQDSIPFFPVRVKGAQSVQTATPLCLSCLKEKNDKPCAHGDKKKCLLVTCVTPFFNHGITNGKASIVKIHEIWVIIRICMLYSLP